MEFMYRSGIGELIWPYMTCRPDIGYATVRALIHYHGVRHITKYLYTTKNDGIYVWRPEPRMDLPEAPLPAIRNLIRFERIDTSLNMADHMTKQLGTILFC
ncbi:hypothetical protein ACHAWF_015433 [Thalassiosira exigua]